MEISKVLFSLYYNFQFFFGQDKCKLLYTDTDNMVLEIKSSNVYDILAKRFRSVMDFSNYPKNHPLYNEENKSKLGCLKDETKSEPIKEFCSLKPKLYAYTYGEQVKKTGKGIKKHILSNLTIDSYKECLYNEEISTENQTNIISRKHVVYTKESKRITLNPYSDKNFLINSIDTMAYGNQKIFSAPS